MIQYVCIPTIYMKIQYNESIIDLSKTNDILLVVTLDHMKYDKSKNYNDLFLLWENHFKKYKSISKRKLSKNKISFWQEL